MEKYQQVIKKMENFCNLKDFQIAEILKCYFSYISDCCDSHDKKFTIPHLASFQFNRLRVEKQIAKNEKKIEFCNMTGNMKKINQLEETNKMLKQIIEDHEKTNKKSK